MEINVIYMTDDPVLSIASAFGITRGLSYKEFQSKYSREQQERLITDCYRSGHLSGFEFAEIDVEVLGVSRVFETEKVRSRLSSYEVEAGQYSEARGFEMINPGGIYSQKTVDERQAIIKQWNEEDKAKGIDPRFRRYFTYQGLSRNMRIKKNFRAWMETSWLRMCSTTQWEYKQFMSEFKQEIAKREPFLAEFLQSKCVRLGYCTEAWKPCGKYPKKEN